MAQLGEQLAMVLRSGRAVMRMTPKRASQEQASGADELASPNAPMSPGQADFGAQPTPSPLLRRMHAALARVGGGGKTPTESGGPASLNFLDVTPERPRRPPEQARLSDVDLQAGASGQILQALHRLAQEVQQVRAEVKEGRAEMEKWRAEMEKTVRTVAQNEAQLRTQILGTAEGLVRVEQKLQEEVAQMCAKLEMMQHEQEKKKGNEEERLKALVREHVGKLVKQLEEKEDAKLQGYQQSLEEWLEERMCREIEERMCREIERQKRGQKEFKLTIAGKVDKFIHEMQEEVTTVLEKCEKLAEQLRQYETPLKFDDQWPQLEQEGPEQGQPTQKQCEAPAELRYETEKLADNDQVEAQEEPTLDAAEVAADAQEMPTLTQSEENEVAADTHNERSRRSTLPYGDQEEHETTAKYLPGSFRAPTVATGTSTGVASDGPSGFALGATKSAAPVQPASAAVKNSAERGQEAASELPSRADMFKPKPGEWDCQTCKTLARYPPTATIRCVVCWEKPGAPAQAAVGGSRLDRLIETYDAIRAAQDALRAEWEEKEKLRPLSQERTIQSVAAAEGDAVGG